MDRFSAQLANALLGKALNDPLIEIHFPASTFSFEQATIICITGADFTPTINGRPISLAEPVYIPANSLLEFTKVKNGVWCYLSLLHQLDIVPWLNSYSTNAKIEAGGLKGKQLRKGDEIHFKNKLSLTKYNTAQPLHWHAREVTNFSNKRIHFVRGSEWNWLTRDAKTFLESENFQVLQQAERMAYRLQGFGLQTKKEQQLVSSAVCAGTLQLIPSGQLIALMADHQTTGGYPRVGQIISTDIALLAQQQPGSFVHFKSIDLKTAEQKIIEQHKYLQNLQMACAYNMQNFIHAAL